MNLFKDLRENFGQNIVRTVIEWECTEKKLSRHRNHLVFGLRCKQEEVIPVSLKVKNPIRSQRAKDIIAEARKALLRERIRITTNKIREFSSSSKLLREDLSKSLPEDLLNKTHAFVEKSREKEFTRRN